MGSVPYGDTGPWMKDLCVTGTNANTVTFASQRRYGEGMELGTVQVSGGKVVYSDRRPKGECWLPGDPPLVIPPWIERVDWSKLRPAPKPPPAPANELVTGVPVWNYRLDDIHLGWYALGTLAYAVMDWLSPAWGWL